MVNLLNPVTQQPIILQGISDGVLYHYTSIEGFKGIIKNGNFLLSNYVNLADNEELRWASDQFLKTFRPLFPSGFSFPELLPETYFIFCTCKRSDNAFLWNNYASKKQGIVFAINVSALYNQFNLVNRYVDMMPMEYDRGAFIELCQQAVKNLAPIGINVIASPRGQQFPKSQSERRAFFNGIPGYAEYMKKRTLVIEAMMLQKAPKFKKEEEIRIFNWPDIHKPMPRIFFKNKERAEMPWRFKNGHIITEILRTNACKLSELDIAKYLKTYGISCPVRTIDNLN